MSRIERFEDLDGWKLARALTGLIYNASGTGEFSRDFALRDQIRRAAISIVSNIAEGFERDGDKEFLQFLSMVRAHAVRSVPNFTLPSTVPIFLRNSSQTFAAKQLNQ